MASVRRSKDFFWSAVLWEVRRVFAILTLVSDICASLLHFRDQKKESRTWTSESAEFEVSQNEKFHSKSVCAVGILK